MHTSNTVTEKLQLAVFPAASVAVQVTVVDPTDGFLLVFHCRQTKVDNGSVAQL